MINELLQLRKRNYFITGRGSTAIYLILLSNEIKNKWVLVPANICYAAIYPLLYSGNKPLFVDVSDDGNLSLELIAKACDKISSSNISAVLLPHMYGNPCQDVERIADYLSQRNIILIEDCALAMGAELADKKVGIFGNYAIYSFGYSKTIDIGNGGLIVSSKNLDRIADYANQLPQLSTKSIHDLKLLSQLYRVIRNNGENELVRFIFAMIPKLYYDAFIYKADEALIKIIESKIENLSSVINERRQKELYYHSQLKENAALAIYKFSEGAVPWRFNLLVYPPIKQNLIDYLLENRVVVSDWYPVVSPMFGVYDEFPTASKMEKAILNFPVHSISYSEIDRVCNLINCYFSQHV